MNEKELNENILKQLKKKRNLELIGTILFPNPFTLVSMFGTAKSIKEVKKELNNEL